MFSPFLYRGRSLNYLTKKILLSQFVVFADLVEEEVVDVVGEEGSELALLGLAGAHVHLDLLNESGENSQNRQRR